MRALIIVPLLAACSGGDGDTDGTQTALACDDIVTRPLQQVPVQDWPDQDAIRGLRDLYLSLDGLFDVGSNSCGGEPTQVKIEVGDPELFDVILEPWPSNLDCGCTVDPAFEADSKYNPVAIHQNPGNELSMSVVVTAFDDPGVRNNNLGNEPTVEPTTVTAFAIGDPLSIRGCVGKQIDPALGSAYRDYNVVVRRDNIGIEVDLALTNQSDGGTTVCELRSLTFVE